ncbi:hypothetical protein ABZ215_24915 [Amycolatopsis sp. NPDC006131]|uniref:hypothetical protein n=1 Tax=Amycolatopsis sp. NPDC006131 TaxID=3156731 RepID=UPI0033AB35A2
MTDTQRDYSTAGEPDTAPTYEQLVDACHRLNNECNELQADIDKVAEFCDERADYITSIENCHPDNDRDYWRWQGHAEARRQLSQKLGLPVAWPEAPALTQPVEEARS